MLVLGPLVQMRDHSITTRDGASIEARSYRPADAPADEPLPVYLYFHGGGFLTGTLASEDAACAATALRGHVAVLNVNYRHTPEHAFPTAWFDSQDAFEWLHDNMAAVGGDPLRVVVGGVSAGAQLTAALVLGQHLGRVAASRPRIAGQVLVIPLLVHPDHYGPQAAQLSDVALSSYVENHDAPMLPVSVIRLFVDLLRIGEIHDGDLLANPGNATPADVRGLPPTVFGVAGLDPLRDEGLLFAKKLAEAGVATDVTLFRGVPHAFRGFGDELSASKHWDDVVGNGIAWALSKPAPTGVFEIKEKR
ncbi:esterase/lipase [Lasiosphaeria miniovina]|uniref:Esterase/lipase n=1 Tax=Lasiosphaeria miniovina TaxID=1954250 RepID=A0AA40AWM4_9PEZI|nr:esterase/lipase [Lasiosphaeria miniovina]KAK0723339.1 esterase/lipase [Lasiosphaeria miniovina]